MQSIPPLSFFTKSFEETQEVGKEISKLLKPKDVLCLTGDLGAGKTTFVKGIAQMLTGIDPEEVTSPTFTYLNIYLGKQNLYHFDLYRLPSSKDFLESGFHEFLNQNAICCVEWPDKIPSQILFQKVAVHIDYLSSEERKITFWRPHDL